LTGHTATLTFDRDVAALVATLRQAWTAPAARTMWAAPVPSVTVEFLETKLRVSGHEISLCKVVGQPDLRCKRGWLELREAARAVNYVAVSCGHAPVNSPGHSGFRGNGQWQPSECDRTAVTAGR